MNFSFMSFSCPELTLDQLLALAKRLGYDSVEPRAQSEHKHGVELDASADARREIKQRSEDVGVSYCCVATSCQYADPDKVKQQLEDTRRAIDLGADIGSPCLRVFGGTIGGGLDRNGAIDLLAESLGSVADQARDRGVIVCIETHDDWCNPDHLAQVMKKVDHPNIAVNWDIMHPIRRGGVTMDHAFEALRPWVRHTHVHDGVSEGDKLTLVPTGQGEIDHRRALELLIEMDYQGAISGEWINWEPYETHLPRELAILKQLESEISAG